MADEDFVDENVKYIREGFEKRVSSNFFSSKLYNFFPISIAIYIDIYPILQLYQESKEGSQLCGCKVNYSFAATRWTNEWLFEWICCVCRMIYLRFKYMYLYLLFRNSECANQMLKVMTSAGGLRAAVHFPRRDWEKTLQHRFSLL